MFKKNEIYEKALSAIKATVAISEEMDSNL